MRYTHVLRLQRVDPKRQMETKHEKHQGRQKKMIARISSQDAIHYPQHYHEHVDKQQPRHRQRRNYAQKILRNEKIGYPER